MFDFTVPSEELMRLKLQLKEFYASLKKESDASWEKVTRLSNLHDEMDQYHEAIGMASAHEKVIRLMEENFPFLKEDS